GHERFPGNGGDGVAQFTGEGAGQLSILGRSAEEEHRPCWFLLIRQEVYFNKLVRPISDVDMFASLFRLVLLTFLRVESQITLPICLARITLASTPFVL